MNLTSENRTPNRFPTLAAIAVTVGVGLADMPYGYYTLLRFMFCLFSVYLLFGAGFVLADWEKWLLGASAVLYNRVWITYGAAGTAIARMK